MSRLTRAVALVAGAVLFAVVQGSARAEAVHPNDAARFLAGMQPSVDSPLAALTLRPNWERHAKWMDSNWATLEERRISRVRAWSRTNLTNCQYPLRYMFSGPDFLFAEAFFPSATTYLLSGLEQVGPIPNVTERTLGSLVKIQQSIAPSLQLSFFRTRDMREQLSGGDGLAGIMPILYVYVARSGKTIREVALIHLDRDGNLRPAGGERRGMVPGVRFTLLSGNGPVQTLYYFSTDLSNSGVASSGFLKFAATLGSGNGMLKAASYLMHGTNFTHVREFILQHSQSIVQDDSGIPFAAFRPELWNFQPFGRYLGPIAIFPGRDQPRLAELFRKMKPAQLEFGIGYRHRGHDFHLLLAVRKEPFKASPPQANQNIPRPPREVAIDGKAPPPNNEE